MSIRYCLILCTRSDSANSTCLSAAWLRKQVFPSFKKVNVIIQKSGDLWGISKFTFTFLKSIMYWICLLTYCINSKLLLCFKQQFKQSRFINRFVNFQYISNPWTANFETYCSVFSSFSLLFNFFLSGFQIFLKNNTLFSLNISITQR